MGIFGGGGGAFAASIVRIAKNNCFLFHGEESFCQKDVVVHFRFDFFIVMTAFDHNEDLVHRDGRRRIRNGLVVATGDENNTTIGFDKSVVNRFGWNKQKLVSLMIMVLEFKKKHERNLLGFSSPQQEWLDRFSFSSQLSSAVASFGTVRLLHETSQAE
jgi:hypothetical protein